MAGISRRIRGTWSACIWRSGIRVLALDQRGHGDSEWARDVAYTNHEMSLDAEAFIEAMGLQRPILIGHSMGGRNAMLLTRRDPSLLRALVIVDVGPELSDRGRAVIAGFVRDNEEFDDLEHFVRNVQQYDPYRSREHIERTVKYNMLQRADGKFVSKCDANPRRLGVVRGIGPLENITLDDARAFDLPVLLVRGADSAHSDGGGGGAVPRRAAARYAGDRAELRPQRAWAEHDGVHRGSGPIPDRVAVGAALGRPLAQDLVALAQCVDHGLRRHRAREQPVAVEEE